jgi:acyl-CoA thioesterase I
VVAALGEADGGEQLVGPRPASAAEELERQQHVLARRQVAEELEALEDEADAAAPQQRQLRSSERAVDRLAVEPHLALVGTVEAGHQGEQRRLAAPRRPEDGDRTRRARRGLPIAMLNAGVSGDTTAGGLARLDWLLRQEPAIVVVGLGANDGLRALSPAATEANLRAILERVQAAGAHAVLAGMRVPPNYGPDYVRDFEAVYPRLAAEHDVLFIPFLLAGVAADPALNLRDGIHPNAAGQRVVARTVADALSPLVAELAPPAAAAAAAP